MERIEITIGDFLKNAGIVGIQCLLDLSEGQKGVDYGITEDKLALWIDTEFALHLNWTKLTFKAFVKYLGPNTVYPDIVKKIKRCLQKIEDGTWKNGKGAKEEKDDLKYINEKLLSNSYKSGFKNIREEIEYPEVYEKLQKEKLKGQMSEEELKERLEKLLLFLEQPLCIETFTMKSIVYNYINRFWDGKSFLLRNNAQKDMRELFEKDFVFPFQNYLQEEHKRAKETCIDCGMPMSSKEKVSIAFMKDMADDLARKKSAFWDCKVDAFLCPVCTFAYALSPLGVLLLGNKFMFINMNENIVDLLRYNSKYSKIMNEIEQEENEKLVSWFAKIMNHILEEKTIEIKNIQVILKGTRAEDRYMFQIIQKEALQVLKKEKVKKELKKLEKRAIVKDGSDYINVYEKVIWNLLSGQSQYPILNRLLKLSLENDSVVGIATYVYAIQIWMNVVKRKIREKKEESKAIMNCYNMRDEGYELRKALLKAKNATKDDCIRGTVYQLLNALSVKNVERFMEIVMRIYCSCDRLVPDGFVNMLGKRELFLELGYAFVLGLKGGHPGEKKEGGEQR